MLNKKVKRLICGTITSMMLFSTVTAFADGIVNIDSAEVTSVSVTGKYDIVVEGFDWGPGVTKAIIKLENEVSDVTKEKFKVEEVKQGYNYQDMSVINGTYERKVINAYLSDENGKQVEGTSKNIILELAVDPNMGNLFFYNIFKGLNNWSDPYYLNIKLAEGATLKSEDKVVDKLEINTEYVKRNTPTVDAFKEDVYEGEKTINYAHYSPADDNHKNPLIIWLHGGGEGGNDTQIATLGNKVGALITSEIQNQFDGAYVLAPQSPTMWMDSGEGYTKDGSTIYLDPLMDLIKTYANSNSDIDLNKIYVGGCSNGGFMTMALVLEDPEYFAGAYPICEAYKSEWISDEKLEGIKDLPIWFTYAKNDEVIYPEETSIPTVERLRNLGNESVKVSAFDKVIDTSNLYKDQDGNPYEYSGHWSWIYAFNDECVDENGDEKLWSWLAKQTKFVELEPSEPVKPEEPEEPVKPEEPEEPVKPEEQEKPVEPVKPEKPEKPNKGNSTTTEIKGDLPNTGAPISSIAVAMIGVLSTAAGVIMRRRK